MFKYLTQLDVIYKNVNEFFAKNPKTKVALFEIDFGKEKAKLKIVREGKKLRIVEGPAGKLLRQKQQAFADQVGQAQSELQKQVNSIQQAQQPVLQLSAPAGNSAMPPMDNPAPGLPMSPMGSSAVPASSMPMMPPAPMPPPPMPPPPMAPPPALPAQAMSMPPLQPGMSSDAGLPPPPAPISKQADAPGAENGSVPLPPGAKDGDINASQAADVVRRLFSAEPAAMQRQFGSVNVGNPNIPPDMAAGTEPPEPEEEAFYPLRDAFMPPSGDVASMDDAESAFDDTMNRMPFSPEKAPPEAQKAMNLAMQVVTNPQKPQDSEDAINLVRGLQGVTHLNNINSGRKRKGNIVREKSREEDHLINNLISNILPFEPSTSEESALVRGLKGQTIKDVSVENDEDSVRISLSLATTDWPVVFEFEKDGKVTYTFKNRRYVLLKKWN